MGEVAVTKDIEPYGVYVGVPDKKVKSRNDNMKKMRIGLIGRVADDKCLFDGQTVKTRTIYHSLIENSFEVELIDTFEYKKHLILTFLKSIKCIFTCDKIILSISINGRRVFFPFLFYAKKIFKIDVYHIVIGGALFDEVKEKPIWIKYLNSFKDNLLESKTLCDKLKEKGVYNARYFPNFKEIKPVALAEIKNNGSSSYKFCIFSRVNKEKGVCTAIQAINEINKKLNNKISILDIYGQVDKEFENEFNDLLIRYNDCVTYKGIIPSNSSVEVLKEYYMLLFPSTWKREGMPGTLIDALFSGLPTIASDWNYNSEIINDKVTGFLYDVNKPETFRNLILYSINNPNLIYKMRFNCINKATEFLCDDAIKKLISILSEE